MTVRTILKWPNPTLARVAECVRQVDDTTISLARDLRDTMRAAFGAGLAAPQVGVGLAMCVIDHKQCAGHLPPDPAINDVVVMVNPTWSAIDAATFSWEEGCLSVDDIRANVSRHKSIDLVYTDLGGITHSFTIKDKVVSGIVQHETDHLVGKVFIDRLSPRRAKNIRHNFLRKKRLEKKALVKAARKERIEELREQRAEEGDRPPTIGRPKRKRIKKAKSFGRNKRRNK